MNPQKSTKRRKKTALPIYSAAHKCEVPACASEIPPYRHVCDEHWKQIPNEMRHRVAFNHQIYLNVLSLASGGASNFTPCCAPV